MRKPALLVAVFVVACASTPMATVPGRHALVLERTTNMPNESFMNFESEIEAALGGRLESVTRVASVEDGAGYDDVIVIKWGSQYRPSMSPRVPDASAENVSRSPAPMANYEILRGGKRVAGGSLSVAGTTTAAAVNGLTADIARKLTR